MKEWTTTETTWGTVKHRGQYFYIKYEVEGKVYWIGYFTSVRNNNGTPWNFNNNSVTGKRATEQEVIDYLEKLEKVTPPY